VTFGSRCGLLPVLGAAVILVGSSCGGSGSKEVVVVTVTSTSAVDPSATVENLPESRPGSAAVYARIESSRNCVALQREFDIAYANNQRAQDAGDETTANMSFSYMEAADARMKEVGCYG
jgi:hypothetical protein